LIPSSSLASQSFLGFSFAINGAGEPRAAHQLCVCLFVCLRWRRREKGEREKKKRKNRYSVLVDVVVDRRKNSTSTTSSKSFSFPQTNTAAITVICNDGRVIAGTLRGFDQAVNLILSDCVERVFSADAGTELQPLGGLHVIRGDNVAVVGEIDADKEEGADWGSKRAAPLPPVTH